MTFFILSLKLYKFPSKPNTTHVFGVYGSSFEYKILLIKIFQRSHQTQTLKLQPTILQSVLQDVQYWSGRRVVSNMTYLGAVTATLAELGLRPAQMFAQWCRVYRNKQYNLVL